jgi:hypothetical protein
MTDHLTENKVIQGRVYSSLQDSAYVETFLARKFGSIYGSKSPKPRHVEVYAGKSKTSRVMAKGEDFSPASNRLNETLT